MFAIDMKSARKREVEASLEFPNISSALDTAQIRKWGSTVDFHSPKLCAGVSSEHI